MIDWKKIRDKRNSLIQLELNNPQSLFATRQRRCFENYNFPLLIQALEEQEKRIEFLEKALDQAKWVTSMRVEDGYVVMELDAPSGSESSTTINRFLGAGLPELTKYLEEKNG